MIELWCYKYHTDYRLSSTPIYDTYDLWFTVGLMQRYSIFITKLGKDQKAEGSDMDFCHMLHLTF